MDRWIRGPIGLDADRRITRPGCRNAVVVVPTMTAGTRLLDVLPLLEADHRVQTVFTVPHTGDGWHGVEEFVRAQHGLVLPWHQAVQHRFDLVLAASHRHLDELHGPILLLAHGAGTAKSRRHSRKAGAATNPTTGLDRELLTYRGRILPAVLGLATDAELAALRRSCPEAVPRALVAGDICLDEMLGSIPLRENYRHGLGVKPGHRLVTVSSTWSTDSVFGRLPRLCRALRDALPPSRYAVAAVLHPNVWTVHGRRQVTAWFADCLRDGLLLIPPDQGWQATMVASDWVIGDYGSTTAYAAALGRPVTVAADGGSAIRTGSIADLVCRNAPGLRCDVALPLQEEIASRASERLARVVRAAITSRPGQAAALLRSAMYELLALPEPDGEASARLLPSPNPLRDVA
ncbi:hypothetical protein [Amycolatopsis sp. NPDC051128]|uniref:hypothetical protein n=1 Tax=Amycolatopsis sp. NPDC051128 TaxID=3155412 RepID=UPI00342CC7F1